MNYNYLLSVIPVLLLAGCASQPNHQGINWGEGPCPKPAPQSISVTNHLVIEDGKTLKCQIRPYVSNMACQGIVDGEDEGAICQDNAGNQIIFLFDRNGVLTAHRSRSAG